MFLFRVFFFSLALATLLPHGIRAADTVQVGPFLFEFATAKQGSDVLGREDEYVKQMSLFDRQVRMQSVEDPGRDAYLGFAAQAARDWPKDAKDSIANALGDISERLGELKMPTIEKILIVHTDGSEEAGAAYTRSNAIILPPGEVGTSDRRKRSVMAHELFHVLSRHHPDMRDALYKRIGFYRRGFTFPDAMKELKLTNPDAPTIAHVMDIKMEGDKKITVAPVVFSQREYEANRGMSLFSTMEFRLLEVKEIVGKQVVANLKEGKPILHRPYFPDFKRQIGRNTRYIVHPEEILADNFAFLVTGKENVPDPWVLEAIKEELAAEVDRKSKTSENVSSEN